MVLLSFQSLPWRTLPVYKSQIFFDLLIIIIIPLLCKTEIPQVLLIGGANSFYNNRTNSWIYNLTQAQKKQLQISCISKNPTRWTWKIEEGDPKAISLNKERYLNNSTKQSKFVSNLTINLVTSTSYYYYEPVSTNFSCSTNLDIIEDGLHHNVTCVELVRKGLEPIQLQIFYGISFQQCLQIVESINNPCTNDLIIDLKTSRGACKNQKYTTNIKTTRCENLDTCKNYNVDFNLTPLNGKRSCSNEAFGSVNATDHSIVLNDDAMFPLIVYCEKVVDNGWSSFLFLYPSFNETWERLSYFKTVEDARHNKSVELIALQHGQTSFTQINDLNRRKQFAVGEIVTFVCVAVKYLFMNNFQWTIGNESSFHSSDENGKELSSVINNGNYNQYLHLVPRKILMNATAYGHSFTVTCYAPVWNSEDYVSFRINISLSPAVSPSATLTCKEGVMTIDCSCQYSGWPKPTITWNDKLLNNLSRVDKDVHESSETIDAHQRNWINNKTFLKVETSTAREIECIAINFAGDDNDLYTTRKATSLPILYIIGWTTLGVVVLIVIFVAIITMLCLRVKRLQKTLTKSDVREFMYGIFDDAVAQQGAVYEVESALKNPYDKSYEISKESLEINSHALLGSGQFGCVFKALIQSDEVIEVALKMPKPNCPKHALKGLLSEIKILIYLGKHPNIVSIIGAYTAEIANGIVYLATELCNLGSLQGYLRDNQRNFAANSEHPNAPLCTGEYSNAIELRAEITFLEMVQWSHEIACGMEYLGIKNVIHADLATRNVLLASDKTVKITDFGLSRRLYDYTNYVKKQQEPLPWRWMAIESLRKAEFSAKSDIWSYGVTLWEIFTMGDFPYPGLSWNLDFVDNLVNGLRMKSPRHATSEIYKVMVDCWHLEPNDRPTFADLKLIMDQIINKRASTFPQQDSQDKVPSESQVS